jgi:hypothetical protein
MLAAHPFAALAFHCGTRTAPSMRSASARMDVPDITITRQN